MLLAAVSWCWIGIAAFLCGFAVLECVFPREREGKRGVDLYLMAGLCVLTVYAQSFSLFYKVGGIATGILIMSCLIIALLLLRKKICDYCKRLTRDTKWYWAVFFFFLAALILVLTIQRTFHADTDGYHAQSIRWVEALGVVKGMGNLYHRLAYNSAFFCLQALFSMDFAVNQSLHTMNGFIAAVMLCYAMGTLSVFKKERIKSSDLIKLCLVYYLCFFDNRWQLSSPGSDISALSVLLYTGARWCELDEQNSEDVTEYGVLCLLAVWACTLKISVSMIVLIAIYPAVCLIRHKKWKQTALFLGSGIIIVLPFLIRNVIISGYLIYPFGALDLFDVDWKMSPAVLREDSMEITVWGRGSTSMEMYDAPFRTWFPVWFQSLGIWYRALFVCSVLCILYAAVDMVMCIKHKKNVRRLNLLAANVAGYIFWFFSAPLIRYGIVYMLIFPAMILGELCAGWKHTWIPKAGAVMVSLAGLILLLDTASFYGAIPWKRPAEYFYHDVDQVQLDGLTIYVPQPPDDEVGYHFFPSTQYREMVERIELRTGRLEDGFRLKEEYKNTGKY